MLPQFIDHRARIPGIWPAVAAGIPPPGIPRVCHGMTGAFGRPRRPITMLDQRSGQDRGNPIKDGRVHRNARGHPGPRRRATIAGQMRPVLGPDRIDQCR